MTTSPKRAIVLIISAMLIFSLVNAVVKDTIAQYNTIQLGFFRFFFASLPAACFLLSRNYWIVPSKAEWKLHGIRTVLYAISLPVMFLGVGLLPLSNSMSLYFSSTLFLVGLSYPILKERPSRVQWLSVGLGFFGVLVIAKPDVGILKWAALFVIIGAFTESAANLFGRLLSKTHNGYLLTFLGSLLPGLLLGCLLPFVWITPPDIWSWASLLFLGLGGGVGQLCVTFAFRFAPAGTVAPMIYTAILWSILLDFVLYDYWPSFSLFVGCAIIVSAGLLIVFSERKARKSNQSSED